MELTDNIIELNRDLEPFIVQASSPRPAPFRRKYGDKFTPLQFVHFSDVHAVLDLWNRVVEYVNYYKDYISFAIHTGDYCGGYQELYVDCYGYGTKCVRPILNCVGNHDIVTTPKWLPNDKQSAHRLLFNHLPEFGAKFFDCEHSMTYYKDFPASNIRLIVLDLYFDIEAQLEWLKEMLNDAKEKDMCVITAMHEPSAAIVNSHDVTFHSYNDYETLTGGTKQQPFEPIIVDFIKNGGCHICNLAGHVHHDLFGYTEAGVLNVAVPCASDWAGWCDGKRVKGTRTYDCFNVMSVDTDLGIIKIIRVGDNVDHYLRQKRVLCFDYINKKVIYNG